MKKEEALEHFYENYVKKKSLEKVQMLENYYENNRDVLAEGFLESFSRICLKIKQMQQEGKKGKIGYITYSMLRTNIMDGIHVFPVEGFNKLWFFDRIECQVEYDVSWAFRFLNEFEEELIEKSKLYINKIVKPDIERFKLKETVLYINRIIELARYAMPKAVEINEFKDIIKEDVLEVRVGEYKGLSEVVYKEDIRPKDPMEIKYWLEEKYENEYAYEVLKDLDLSCGDYEGIDIRYGNLKRSDVSKSIMKNCNLVGVNFGECLLEETDFSGAKIDKTDFNGANLSNAIFNAVEAKGASFRMANLQGASFEGADLSYSDMRGANLKDVNFNGANLEGTKLSGKDIHSINLSEEQRKAVIKEL